MTHEGDGSTLEARVAASTTPHERAALLGLDFPRLTRGVNRLYAVYFAMVAIPMVLALLASVQITAPNSPPLTLLATLGGVMTALLFGAASFLLAVGVGSIPPLRALRLAQRQLLMIEVRFLLEVLGLVAATQLVHSLAWLFGVFVGALAARMFDLLGHVSVVESIRKNRPGLVDMVRANEPLPRWASPLTGEVNWSATAVVAGVVTTSFEVILYSQVPLAAFLVIVTGASLHALAVLGMARNRPVLWLLPQIALVAIVVAATITLVPLVS